MSNEIITFIPGVELRVSQDDVNFQIKGESPRLSYNFMLRDIYPLVPSLDTYHAYQKIKEELDYLDDHLCNRLSLRTTFRLPPTVNDFEAACVLRRLIDPACYEIDRILQGLSLSNSEGLNIDLIKLNTPLPFPLRMASADQLIHTMGWIDTNIKVSVENITKPYKLQISDVHRIVETALRIYSYLVKQQDYQLARSINFNYSIFLQDRILNIIFGDKIYLARMLRQKRGKLANNIALQLLKKVKSPSYMEILTMTAFAGVIWLCRGDTQRGFIEDAEKTLENIYSDLKSYKKHWCIDDTSLFVREVGVGRPTTIVVVLDDNGESVFDAAIFQQLLNEFKLLKVVFIVNSYPVSNNIDVSVFQALLKDEYFASLRRFFFEGRAALCIEMQMFRSFEIAYLRDQTWSVIKNATMMYIKGSSFFETMQIPCVSRYHCFTVFGETSILLTGCTKGGGIFAKLTSGEIGYIYHSYDHIETLKDRLTSREAKTNAI